MQQVTKLDSAVRKTARGEHEADEVAALLEEHRLSVIALRAAVLSEPEDPQTEIAIRVLNTLDTLTSSLAASPVIPTAMAELKDMVACLAAAPAARPRAPELRRSLFDALEALRVRARRLEFLIPFVDAVCAATRDKWFTIHDEVAWVMMLDMRDHLVVDLADWAKTAHTPGAGGFLRMLQTHHLAAFGDRRSWGDDIDDSYVQRIQDEGHRAARQRLLPTAGATARQPDFDALARVFRKTFEPLTKDRHANRAHAYQHEMSRGASVRMLNLREIAEVVEYADRVVRDLLLVAEGVSYARPRSGFYLGTKDTVKNLIETTLISRRTRSVLARHGITTETFFAELHAHDESPPDDGTPRDEGPRRPTFNDWAAERRARERLGLGETIAA